MKSILLLFLVLTLSPAIAFSSGNIEGILLVNGDTVQLRHAYAHLHDNAEGLVDSGKLLRIVLTDREVPAEALAGIIFLPVEEMAQRDLVRGLLVELNPNDPGSIYVTLLYPPSEPGRQLMTTTLSSTDKAITNWMFNKQQVSGAIEHFEDSEWDFPDLPKLTYSLKFSAPLSHEPAVTADLKKKEAANSPQVRVLSAKADALVRGDFATVRKLSSERANRRNDVIFSMGESEVKALAKRAGTDMKKSIKKVKRVVVRGDRAVVLVSHNEWSTLVLEGGEWKSDD